MPRRDHKGCCWSLELSSHFSGRAFFLVPESWGARAWIHIQRSARDEFGRSAGNWARGSSERIELGVLFVRGGIFAGGGDDHAVAGDVGERAGVISITNSRTPFLLHGLDRNRFFRCVPPRELHDHD